jgi:hypothetical protein
VRQAADLEHWAAFPHSFDALTELVAEAGSGPGAPATVCVLSGDVHHAYVAEPHWADGGTQGRPPDAAVLQLTCSPVHNSVPASMKLGFTVGWSPLGRMLGRALAWHGRVGRRGRRVPRPAIGWRKAGGPWFGNQLMTLTLRGRAAHLRLEQARVGDDGRARLASVFTTVFGGSTDASRGGTYGAGARGRAGAEQAATEPGAGPGGPHDTPSDMRRR